MSRFFIELTVRGEDADCTQAMEVYAEDIELALSGCVPALADEIGERMSKGNPSSPDDIRNLMDGKAETRKIMAEPAYISKG